MNLPFVSRRYHQRITAVLRAENDGLRRELRQLSTAPLPCRSLSQCTATRSAADHWRNHLAELAAEAAPVLDGRLPGGGS